MRWRPRSERDAEINRTKKPRRRARRGFFVCISVDQPPLVSRGAGTGSTAVMRHLPPGIRREVTR